MNGLVMMEEDKLINEYRKRSFQEELPLRDDGWEKLEAALAANPQSPVFPYRWLVAAGILLLYTIGSIYYFADTVPVRIPVAIKHSVPVATRSGELSVLKEEPVKRVSLPSSQVISRKVRKLADERLACVTERLLPPVAYISMKTLSVDELLNNVHERELVKKKKARFPYSATCTTLSARRATVPTTWTFGLCAGNVPNSSYSASEGLRMFNVPATRSSVLINNAPGFGSLEDFRNELASNASNFQTKGEYSAFEKVAMNNYGIPTHTKVKHKFPVSAGISVRKQLTSRLALESGLLYTLLSSDLYAGEDNAHYFQEQRLHYLGIPLKINYAFWKKERLSFYVSGGGMMEFCMDGSLRSDYYLNLIREHSSKTDLDVKRPQFSVLSSVGMQFAIIRSVSLYAEPGIAYYFDDKNKIETIRKEHPFTISLQLGLRISF